MKLLLVIAAIATVGLATLLGLENRAQIRLRDENQSLRSRLDDASALIAENERLSNALAQAEADHAAARRQLSELLRLRAEVGGLRQKTNQLAKLQQSNRPSPAPRAQSPQPAASHYTPLSASEQSDFPKESWTFAGYATPDASYQTGLWAQLNNDKENFLQSLTPEKRQQIETMIEQAHRQGVSDEQLKAQNDGQLAGITGFQVLGREVLAADQIRLQISIGGREIHPVLKKIGNEWKIQNLD